MFVIRKVARAAVGLWPVFMVAVMVALVSTVAGSVVDHVHQVDAEQMASDEMAATPAANGTQTLTIKDWGISLTLPLASEMPLLSYARESSASVGLSSADLEKQGPDCTAARNGLGALVRLPAGTFNAYVRRDLGARFIRTSGAYDYVYDSAANDCEDSTVAAGIVNREQSVVFEALDSFELLGQ